MEINKAKQAQINEVLAKPYRRSVIPLQEEGFHAEIIEFKGCIATGDTLEEAYRNLESVAEGWLLSALERGNKIPEPLASNEYSGKLVLRMPKGLHQKAALFAQQEQVSLNNFIVSAISMAVGSKSLAASSGGVAAIHIHMPPADRLTQPVVRESVGTFKPQFYPTIDQFTSGELHTSRSLIENPKELGQSYA